MNEKWNNKRTEILKNIMIWEFEPGSGWTLAACLTHASRRMKEYHMPAAAVIRGNKAWKNQIFMRKEGEMLG